MVVSTIVKFKFFVEKISLFRIQLVFNGLRLW